MGKQSTRELPSAREQALEASLRALLERDRSNTCQHENTQRGGAIWTKCDDCDAKWADGEGGKPAWRDPEEWDAAESAIMMPRERVQRSLRFDNAEFSAYLGLNGLEAMQAARKGSGGLPAPALGMLMVTAAELSRAECTRAPR